jgi:hypothetical protein
MVLPVLEKQHFKKKGKHGEGRKYGDHDLQDAVVAESLV